MYPDQSALSTQGSTNPLAITSLISSAVGWVLGGFGSCGVLLILPPLSFCTGLLFVLGCVVGVVTGHMARSQIQASHGGQTGQAMAVTGLVLGWIGVGMVILSICLALLAVVALALMGPAIGNVFSSIILDI